MSIQFDFQTIQILANALSDVRCTKGLTLQLFRCPAVVLPGRSSPVPPAPIPTGRVREDISRLNSAIFLAYALRKFSPENLTIDLT